MKTCLAPALILCATLGLAAPAGAAVHVRGDFNGDGRADLAIGAPDESVAGNDHAGAVHVLYGSRDGLRAAGNQQFTQDTPGMTGSAEAGDRFGTSLAVGDLDGDGFSDLAVGAPAEGVSAGDGRDRREAGSVTVIYGSEDGLDGGRTQVWTQDSPGIDGQAEAGDRFGQSVAVGDFDGNGFDDLASGVPGESVGDLAGAGAVNVIYGSRRGLRDNLDDLWTRDSPGVKGTAAEEDRFGHAVAAADVSSNNFSELIVGVPGAEVKGSPAPVPCTSSTAGREACRPIPTSCGLRTPRASGASRPRATASARRWPSATSTATVSAISPSGCHPRRSAARAKPAPRTSSTGRTPVCARRAISCGRRTQRASRRRPPPATASEHRWWRATSPATEPTTSPSASRGRG